MKDILLGGITILIIIFPAACYFRLLWIGKKIGAKRGGAG